MDEDSELPIGRLLFGVFSTPLMPGVFFVVTARADYNNPPRFSVLPEVFFLPLFAAAPTMLLLFLPCHLIFRNVEYFGWRNYVLVGMLAGFILTFIFGANLEQDFMIHWGALLALLFLGALSGWYFWAALYASLKTFVVVISSILLLAVSAGLLSSLGVRFLLG